MLRSMLSAGSALRNHQTYMDVIANNIANVNTASYKSMRVTFHELLSQVMSSGAAPQNARGGINPIQIGLGMTLGATDGIFTQGAMQATGRTSDLALQGNGFFVYQNGGQSLYSRDGAMDLGLDGSLLNSSTGMRVLGWNADATGAIDTNGALAPIMIPLNQTIAQATQNLKIGGNLNAGPVAATIANATTNATATKFDVGTAAAGQTELSSGNYYVEVTAADPAATPPTVATWRLVDNTGAAVSIKDGAAYDANWQTIPAAGTQVDTGRGLLITFGAGPHNTASQASGAASIQYSSSSTPPAATTQVQMFDSLGVSHTIGLTFTKSATNNQWTWQVSSTDGAIVTATPNTPTPITFTNGGQFSTTNTAATISLTFNNGAAAQNVSVDFQNLTQLAQTTDFGVPVQDGFAPGTLTGYTITNSGQVECTYANGMRKVLAQIAVANFANPGGLLRVGDNMFAVGSNSGNPATGLPGTGGRGVVQAGYVEAANVDLAQQFTSMISAQRGFQANSRVISASDQMLQDLVNLVR